MNSRWHERSRRILGGEILVSRNEVIRSIFRAPRMISRSFPITLRRGVGGVFGARDDAGTDVVIL
ncbi:hypothetical protein [Streptomyces sp. CB01580]|uniref:hypothetical protein n=1 Tax=Streptomyces sp. CB01580 TaxID=1703933 RepID=UPI00116154C4|nr:hypothetical protein [Streptomyces sp. CB01580]